MTGNGSHFPVRTSAIYGPDLDQQKANQRVWSKMALQAPSKHRRLNPSSNCPVRHQKHALDMFRLK